MFSIIILISDLRQELGVRKRPASESSNKQDTDDNVTTPTNITSKLERLSSQTNSHVTPVVRPDSLSSEYQSNHVQGASVTPNNKGNNSLPDMSILHSFRDESFFHLKPSFT